MKILRFKGEPTLKYLRSYTRIARQEHTCWKCNACIQPGEEYQANVVVYCGEWKKFYVEKFHLRCPPNPFDEH